MSNRQVTDFIIELKVEPKNSQAARILTEWRCVASCWLRFGDDEQFGEGIKKQPIVGQDKYKGEWVALDPKTDAVLSHSRSLAEAEQRAIEQGTEPVMEFVPESDGYFVGQL
jgi:hypothetical protein